MDNIETQTGDQTIDTTTVTETEGVEAQAQPTEEISEAPATEETKPYVPFSAGKEKVKVNGKEYEWTFDEFKKYAQLGNSATQKMQEAAAEKKRVEKLYSDIITLAQKDPNALVRAFNPSYNAASATATQQTTESNKEQNPLEQDLYLLKNELTQTKEQLQQIFLEREKQALQSEMDQVKSKYPKLNNKFALTHLLVEYNKNLESDMSLEDVAFLINKEIEEQERESTAQKQALLTEKRKRAPVSATQGGSTGQKEMGIEDYKRQFGLR